MRKTLSQTLCAAFCAILCAVLSPLSGMGGGGMMLGARTAAWAKSGAPIPYDAEVEWLESVGNQYIALGFVGDDGMTVRIGAQMTGVGVSNSSSRLFGARTSYSERAFVIALSNDGISHTTPISTFYFNFESSSIERPKNDFNYHDFELGKAGAYLDGSLVSAVSGNEFTTAQELKLFTATYLTGVGPEQSHAKVWYCNIEREGEKIIDLIPVRFTNENGVPEGAMYDRISGQLFRNAGTGAFIIGPDANTPVPCRELTED